MQCTDSNDAPLLQNACQHRAEEQEWRQWQSDVFAIACAPFLSGRSGAEPDSGAVAGRGGRCPRWRSTAVGVQTSTDVDARVLARRRARTAAFILCPRTGIKCARRVNQKKKLSLCLFF